MENSTLIRAYIDNKYNKKTQLLNNVECNDLASVSTNFEEFEYLNFNCDNSGKVFSVNKIKKIVNKHLKQKILLMEGFQSEWKTIKGMDIYVGNQDNTLQPKMKWLKLIDNKYNVEQSQWLQYYDKIMQKLMGLKNFKNGYIISECILWSDIHQKWFFCPRKFSEYPYNIKNDWKMGTNLLISCDKNFDQINTLRVLDFRPLRGCTAMEFVPNTGDTEIICCRTIETYGRTEFYLSIFNITGQILLEELLIGKQKCVGIIPYAVAETDQKEYKKQMSKIQALNFQEANFQLNLLYMQIQNQQSRHQRLYEELSQKSKCPNTMTKMVEFLDKVFQADKEKKDFI